MLAFEAKKVRGEGFEPSACRSLPGRVIDYSRPLYQAELPPVIITGATVYNSFHRLPPRGSRGGLFRRRGATWKALSLSHLPPGLPYAPVGRETG